MGQSPKDLIQKFILNQCTPEKVKTLITYFQNKEIHHDFREVEEVLDYLIKEPKLNKEDANRIYKEIHKTAKKDSINLKPRRRFKNYTALAALFVGIIGTALIN